jgi:LuxR family maltose regulon positive regulatory protein
MSTLADCRRGDAALRRGAWAEARDAFAAALSSAETPEALEGLGLASWWLDLADDVFDSRERAYRLFLDRDDRPSAARVAVWLAWDSWAFRGETAVANGWLQRARRLLDGLPDCSELAWLELREGAFALSEDGDPDRANDHAARGIRVAQGIGNKDLELLGRAVQGLALVASGVVAEGMRGLDEVNAAVVAGEMTDRVLIGLACCHLIAACDRVRDYDRALQWCARFKAFGARWGLTPLFAVCRTQYASLCLWRGMWNEAEEELTAATEELAAGRPAMAADSMVRLAELRRRQGRLAEAEELFARAEPHGLAQLGQAELAFDRGDVEAAAEQAARYLRRVVPRNCTDRVAGLELLVRTAARSGDLDGARRGLAELDAIATATRTPSLRAVAMLAAGHVALAGGDAGAAQRSFEDAIDLFLECGAPYEVARVRIELARALGARGRTGAAVREARRAIELLRELRAELEISRAEALIESLTQAPQARSPARQNIARPGLTKREIEVLRLVAADLNSQAIARRLSLSEHTVHRHIANVFQKLSVSSRAAAVAQAARRDLLG